MSDSSQGGNAAPVAWDENLLAERLEGHLQVLETFRRKVVAKRKKGWLAISLSLLVAVLLALALGAIAVEAMFIPAIGFVVAALIIKYKYFGDGPEVYRQEYKKRIIGGMTEAVSPGMAYRPERGLPES